MSNLERVYQTGEEIFDKPLWQMAAPTFLQPVSHPLLALNPTASHCFWRRGENYSSSSQRGRTAPLPLHRASGASQRNTLSSCGTHRKALMPRCHCQYSWSRDDVPTKIFHVVRNIQVWLTPYEWERKPAFCHPQRQPVWSPWTHPAIDGSALTTLSCLGCVSSLGCPHSSSSRLSLLDTARLLRSSAGSSWSSPLFPRAIRVLILMAISI